MKDGNILKIVKISFIIAIGIEVVVVLFNLGSPIVWKREIENILVNFMFAFPLSIVNSYFFQFIGRWYTWEKQPQKRR